MKKTFAVLGGDRRQIELARLLARDGQQVFTCALGLDTDRPLETAGEADVAVLPMPLSKEPGLLNGTKVELGRLWELLRPEQLLCAGQVEEGVLAAAQGRGLTLVDYLKREELAVANAVPTAFAVGHRTGNCSGGRHGIGRTSHILLRWKERTAVPVNRVQHGRRHASENR